MEETHDVQYARLREEVNKELLKAITLLKLVRDTEFRNEAENQLAKLKHVMIEDKRLRISTLEEFKKIIGKGVQKTVSKLVLENPNQRINNGIYGSNTLYNLPDSDYSPSNDRFATNPEQRLALKYPRKKICKSNYDSNCYISGEMSDQPQHSLFKRRHELIAPPPQPTTYGEYKRMSQYQNYMRNQNMLQAATFTRLPLNEYKPSITSKRVANSDQISTSTERDSTSTAITDKLCNSNDMISEHTQTNSSNTVERVWSETTTKNNLQKSDNDGEASATSESVSEVSATATAKTVKYQNINKDSVTAATTSQKQSIHKSLEQDTATSNANIDNITANAESKSKPPKPKSKGNHRELHNLLSYTTEIFPKLIANRRKSVTVEEEINMQLLRKFGITKRVQIVLERADVRPLVSDHDAPGQIAQRTRSKSIDSRKCLESLDARPRQPEPVPKKINHRRESKAHDAKAFKPAVQNHKISHRRESKSLEMKQEPTAVPSFKVPKQTARKSLSNSQKIVAPAVPCSKKGEKIQKAIENVSNEKEMKSTKANIVSRKRERSPSSPTPPKRLCSTTKDSKIFHTADTLRKVGEESDEEETTRVLPSSDLICDPKPNNDPEVHCRSDYMEKCCLCSYNGELMVHHYVYNHPKKAVYVSRVAPDQAQLIKADPLGISGRKAISRYGDQEIIVFRCHFCDLRLSESQELWLDHISKHTGEYRYKCKLCPTFARLPVDRVPHHSICTSPSMQLWHTYAFQENHLYAYLCNVCNFVQVLSVNILRHIREDHPEAAPSEIGYTKFSLVNFSLQDDEADLPYGSVKLEPILDDTNIIPPEYIKEEVDLTPAEDCQTDPLQDVEQEQQIFVQPETVFIKQENPEECIDECEESIAENENDVLTTIQASVPQVADGLLSTRVRVKRLPGDTLSADIEANEPVKVLKVTLPVNRSSPLRINDNRVNRISEVTLSTRTEDNTLKDSVTRNANQVNHSPISQITHYQLQRSAVPSSKSVCSSNGQHQLAPVPSMVVLKPWCKNSDGYSATLPSSKLTLPFLIATFKCTTSGCGFYSDKKQIITIHLQNHQETARMHPIQRGTPWLECCYCSHVGTTIFCLLEHIETVHRYCAYQCDRCCYRSRDSSNVRVHQRNHHAVHDAEAKILYIPDRHKAFEPIDNDIIGNELRSNVMGLKCSICPSKKFYDLNMYRKHIISHNMSYMACHVCEDLMPPRDLINHIHSHEIHMFQCVYCAFGTGDMRIIKKHVADIHPERLLCLHVRTSKPNVPSFIRVQEKISPDRFINFTKS
ncbi:uncharacterized protein LOC126567798 [Anopheles maculipalpis]|uniref:uncharacterized protein LOC126567798 n=1 Tax=Anopheles maculipalpis TaxID=1496333 RepID=UPI002158B0AC|nr:uncharacterized protein LOC126567798 [Anopheles maculipalpis]